MTSSTKSPYAGYRFPGEVISHAVWLYFRFPLSLRMVEEMLAARSIDVSHETVRQWARKFGQGFANQIRRRLPSPGDKWHLDEVCLMIRGSKHWLWRAVDQDGGVLDVLVQKRRDKRAAKRLLRKLLKRQMRPPRVIITDGSCWVSGWWVWVARSEGIWCDGWSVSSQPARARSFCHHGCTGPGQPLGAAGRRQVLRLRAPTPLAGGRALPRLRQRCGNPRRVRRHPTSSAALSLQGVRRAL